MTVLPEVLAGIALFLFLAGAASLIVLTKGYFFLRRRRLANAADAPIFLKSPLVPAVSVIAAPPDVSPESRDLVRRLANLHFGRNELVVVLDGPSETEMETWTREFRLRPSSHEGEPRLALKGQVRKVYESLDPLRLFVVDKEPGGLPDSLNAGVNVATSETIGYFDPEGEFDAAILLTLIRPMLEEPETTMAVCGVMPLPPAGGLLGGIAAIETMRAYLSRCAAFASWQVPVPVPGAAVLVRRNGIVEIGGFRAGILELFLQLHGVAKSSGTSSRIVFVADAISHVRAPRSLVDMRNLTVTDQAEIAGAFRDRGAIRGGLGVLGLGLPGLLSVRFLRPLLETVAYPLAAAGWWLGWINSSMAGLVLVATVGMGTAVSMAAVALGDLADVRESEPSQLGSLFLVAIPENLGYRQLRNLWLISGFFRRVREKRSRGGRP